MIGSKGNNKEDRDINMYYHGTCIIWRCEIKPKGNGNKIISNGKLFNKKTTAVVNHKMW